MCVCVVRNADVNMHSGWWWLGCNVGRLRWKLHESSRATSGSDAVVGGRELRVDAVTFPVPSPLALHTSSLPLSFRVSVLGTMYMQIVRPNWY